MLPVRSVKDVPGPYQTTLATPPSPCFPDLFIL